MDSGSSIDILFYDAFIRMDTLHQLRKVDASITKFLTKLVLTEGIITLPVIVGSAPRRSQIHLTFIIVKTLSAYNVIFG